mgnify:FL=1
MKQRSRRRKDPEGGRQVLPRETTTSSACSAELCLRSALLHSMCLLATRSRFQVPSSKILYTFFQTLPGPRSSCDVCVLAADPGQGRRPMCCGERAAEGEVLVAEEGSATEREKRSVSEGRRCCSEPRTVIHAGLSRVGRLEGHGQSFERKGDGVAVGKTNQRCLRRFVS